MGSHAVDAANGHPVGNVALSHTGLFLLTGCPCLFFKKIAPLHATRSLVCAPDLPVTDILSSTTLLRSISLFVLPDLGFDKSGDYETTSLISPLLRQLSSCQKVLLPQISLGASLQPEELGYRWLAALENDPYDQAVPDWVLVSVSTLSPPSLCIHLTSLFSVRTVRQYFRGLRMSS